MSDEARQEATVDLYVKAPGSDSPGRLFRPISLLDPDLVTAPPPWLGHTPFAFWIMDALRPARFVELGTHSGNSYAAFCQAVRHLGLPTACAAVDTWAGDPQAGHYGEEVYQTFAAHHDARYGAFSRLMRMTFDEALADFADGSIDLLHIDGLHTYEAVRHDFETWLPKVSRSGVILMHDTEVRTGDFGVWRFWEEVQARYPTLNFPFGYGLGVVAVGEAVPDALLALCRLPEPDKAALYALFEALGDRVRLLHEFQEASRHAATYLEQGLQMQKVYEGYKTSAAEQIDLAMAQYRAMFAQATALQGEVAALIGERDALLAERAAKTSL